jgi:predicted RNA polymerase sigma factor
MTAPGPASAIAVSKELDRVMRADRGRLLSVLAAGLRDLSLAEEVLQEAAVSALSHWGRAGPARLAAGLAPAGRAAQGHRPAARATRDSRKARRWRCWPRRGRARTRSIPDERLRLIFACCHPALEPKSRVALTLRTVCGLTTPEIARAFLDAEPTMGQRISRAKAKIAAAGIPFAVPEAEHWPARLEAVLTTIYLIFTTGYVAGPGRTARPVPRGRIPDAPDRPAAPRRCRDRRGAGHDAADRCAAGRADRPDGASLPPANRTAASGTRRACRGPGHPCPRGGAPPPRPVPDQGRHRRLPDGRPAPDWPQIAALYGALLRHEPTPWSN